MVENPVGKILKLENKYEFTITGIMQDVPVNTHFQFSMVGTYSDVNNKILTEDFSNQWAAYFGTYTYVLLPKTTSLQELKTKTIKFYNEAAEISCWCVCKMVLSKTT